MDFNLPDIYNAVGGFLQGDQSQGGLPGYANASVAPALATAAKQYSDAGQYEKLGQQAANMANPFGDRSLYVNKLRDLYTNPNAFMSDPSYQWRLNQGMGNLNRMLNAQGYQGSGKANIDLLNYAQNAASQEWDKEVQRLAMLGGAQFNPADAAKYLMQGGELKLNSQNNALASLFYPYMMQNAARNLQPNGQGGGGGGNTSVMGPASKWIIDQLKTGATIDPNDPHVAEAIREMTPGSGIYDDATNEQNNQDIMDQLGAPPSGSQDVYPGGSSTFDETAGYGTGNLDFGDFDPSVLDYWSNWE